jgi:hypothetical protein
MKKEELLVHYWQLPKEIFVSLNFGFHNKLCKTIQTKIKDNNKNCFYKILDCPKWHAQRIFTQFNRMTITELEKLRKFAGIDKEEVEQNIETIGCHEDGTIIQNPILPFKIKDLTYVASHLMFDGSYRDKRGCYFYAYEPSLVEYHRERLSKFGEVPINFIEGENQLYFSYTIGFIAKKALEIETFKSTKTYLSNKLKKLAKENKNIADEIVKALIIDEGIVEDKIEAELANERLIKSLYDVLNNHYNLTKITSRTRDIDFKLKPEWKYTCSVWNLGFSASSFQDLYNSIFPLPIKYKNENLEFLFKRQTRGFNQRKVGETRKLIVKSLLGSPKTIDELAKELLVKQTTIRAHLKGHQNIKNPLISLRIVDKIGEKILRRGGYAKAGIYGITNMEKAEEFIKE